MYTHILSILLAILGAIGTSALIVLACLVTWHYRGVRLWSFQWHWRTHRLMQLSAIASLFFLAMAASYALLGEVWTWLYLIAAFKTCTWWLRHAISRRT